MKNKSLNRMSVIKLFLLFVFGLLYFGFLIHTAFFDMVLACLFFMTFITVLFIVGSSMYLGEKQREIPVSRFLIFLLMACCCPWLIRETYRIWPNFFWEIILLIFIFYLGFLYVSSKYIKKIKNNHNS